MEDKVVLEIRTPRTGEETPEAMVQFLASLVNLKKQVMLIFKLGIPFALELVVIDQQIRFFLILKKEYQTFFESQLLSQYPKALITVTKDYMPEILNQPGSLYMGRLNLSYDHLLPLRVYTDFKEVDPLSSLLGILGKLEREDSAVIQFVLKPISNSWQRNGERQMLKKTTLSDGTSQANPFAQQIGIKISQYGFKTGIRLLTKSKNPNVFSSIVNAFSSFNNPSGNSLTLKKPFFWQRGDLIRAIVHRNMTYVPRNQILNVSELATLFHLPGKILEDSVNLAWAKTILSQAPENLPVAVDLQDEEKKEINFFAKTVYKNRMATFGIKREDRRKHMYIIGKTGSGKSTLIANMAINDMRNGEGLAVIDPHGDLCETLLDYVPSYRINDVVYLSPADDTSGKSFHLNPLEAGLAHKDLVASGIVSIFNKLYANSWGPRLEYILRNTIMTLLEIPDSTLLMVPELLANQKFRERVTPGLKDPVIRNFWLNEFAQMQPRQQSEAIAPILNKVGQFLSSQRIRNIVGQPKSTVNLEDIMNNKKILLLNLSQGKIGEDNSALLGAMTITKLQLAAMNRVTIPEAERKDFFLYVDEFQNFATTTFIKILSEARKYRLDLILANQYMAQVQEEIQSAIFGNTGTLATFLVGAQDATFLAKEFGERFKEEDLLHLSRYQILMKLNIDGSTSDPFLAQTLPLPKSINQNRQKVILASQERYTRPVPLDTFEPPAIKPSFEKKPFVPKHPGSSNS